MPSVRVEKGTGMERVERHWRWWVTLIWLATCALLVYTRWASIQGFGLGDTDDNMRMMQVRGLLAAQDWFDLRQYRLNPPYGADIHWSRLVDLPIAGIKLALAPLIGGAPAEKVAVAVAPLLPLGVTMGAIAVAARRLVAPNAYLLALAVLLCGHSARSMWTPLRIDHHGWQLALLAVALVSFTDPKRARGGLILGLSSALSLVIGLEMLLYIALFGAAAVLMWVRDPGQARRLATYGGSFAGGAALGYLLFASYANRAPVCDALSPVWLSAVVAAGGASVALALVSPRSLWVRLAAAGLAGALLAGGFALAWPNCLGRLEGASPELISLWLSDVREARPIYRHGMLTTVSVTSLPAAGLIGYAVMLWREKDAERRVVWAAIAAAALLGATLLLWQSRAGPAAQLLAVPGATALGWLLIGWIMSRRLMPVRVIGAVAAFLLVSGVATQHAALLIPEKKAPPMKRVNDANRLCPSLWGLRPVAMVPRGYVLTFVDLSPRLITVTHHDAVAGPYHRNGQDIIDTMRAFRGTPEAALAMIRKRGINYVLICPGMSESTIYASRAKNGFYMQLVHGKVPPWLQPVPLPAKSPFRMWRVVTPRS